MSNWRGREPARMSGVLARFYSPDTGRPFIRMPAQDHVVAKILESRHFTSQKYGPKIAYDLLFENGDMAELVQKPNTPTPQVGDTIFGTIAQDPYNPEKMKLTKENPEYANRPQTSMGSASPPVTMPGNGASGATHATVEHFDARQTSIVRQHSQQMAMMFAQVEHMRGNDISLEKVKMWTDWFARDAEGKEQPAYLQEAAADEAIPF